MAIYIVIGVVVLLLVVLLWGYNSLVTLRNKVNEAFATMDVLLKKRFDLIPSLVEVVKGYARHESDVLLEVTNKRTTATRGAQLNGEVKISDALKSLFVVAEDYPDLKANGNFLKLQDQLVRMEDEISLSRRYYNGSVREFNNRCQVFPMNLIANMFGFKPMPMFSVDSNAERQAVNVNI
ncbi:MAG: LemA family protein [Prevotella sp.]|nr:LemA family protein [Prevotella sp.]